MENGNIDEEILEDETKVVGYARKFVTDNKWLLVGMKKIFPDATDLFLEGIVGDFLILDALHFNGIDKLCWFLSHYRTEKEA